MNANRGMFAESVIERTIEYYQSKKIALIEKRHIPFKIIKILNDNKFLGSLLKKSTVDYTGIYQSKHIDFEVKQTKGNRFDWSNIKSHQFESLKSSQTFGGVSFVIINFFDYDEFFVIDVDFIKEQIKEGKKSIKLTDLRKLFKPLTIQFPGIVDFLSAIEI